MENLLSIELSSVSRGYAFLNQLDRFSQVSVDEASLLSHGRFWLLLHGDHQQLLEIQELLAKSIDKSLIGNQTLVEGCCSSVRASLYSLQSSKVKDYLGIAEATGVSNAVKVAADLSRIDGIELIEILNGRGLDGQAIVYFTGSDENSVKNLLEAAKKNQELSHYETVSPVGDHLSKFFS